MRDVNGATGKTNEILQKRIDSENLNKTELGGEDAAPLPT